jgi:outer membrane lipoprotein-sorting protein
LHKLLLDPIEKMGKWLVIGAAFSALSACAVKHTKRVAQNQPPAPAMTATPAELVERVNRQIEAVKSIVATVDFSPAAISSGVLKEYRDVRGIILAQRPALIRIQGQAPVVRTDIFDMASDGNQFELYVPIKGKFIVGKNTFEKPSKNALESLRPQHIFDAMLLPPIDVSREKYFVEQETDANKNYYLIYVLEPGGDSALTVNRRMWLDRADLEFTRLQLYGPAGNVIEDISYSGYQEYGGVRYPKTTNLVRPIEDYSVVIKLVKAEFNQAIDPQKFVLTKPANAELVRLSELQEAQQPGAETGSRPQASSRTPAPPGGHP